MYSYDLLDDANDEEYDLEPYTITITEELLELGYIPKIAVIIVGNDPEILASEERLEEKAKRIGIYLEKHVFSGDSEEEIIERIKEINSNDRIRAVTMLLPLPENLDEDDVKEYLYDAHKAYCGDENTTLCYAALAMQRFAMIKEKEEKRLYGGY